MFSATGPNAADYGSDRGYPVGEPATYAQLPYLVGSHSNLDQLFRARRVARAATPSTLKRAAAEPRITYGFRGDQRSLDDYLAANPATGLLIAQDDTILVERYQYGRTDRDRFTSWSMAKTVNAMLLGITLAEGRIRSLDEKAESYLPELAGTAYGEASLRDLLTMSSGVAFREDYDGKDDVAILGRATFAPNGEGGLAVLRRFNERKTAAGTKFSYASAESEVLGLVLQRATGRAAAEYLSEKIWQPIGAEADASWLIDAKGNELGYCCINAVLRDYARFALLLAHDGNWHGRQLIPRQWLIDTTAPGAPHLQPRTATSFFGYGYQVWIVPSPRRQFALLGVRGQAIFVDPGSRLVMVHTAVRQQARDPGGAEAVALWRAVAERFQR